MRVSIVATALDGQQPEPKSVINMVHRIQNRNPGYTDYSNSGTTQSFSFTNSNNSIFTNGANALKIDQEVSNDEVKSVLNSDTVETTNNDETKTENFEKTLEISANNTESTEQEIKTDEEKSINNGLENFQLSDEDTPELFNSDINEEVISASDENNSEEDDLEIPAFLRRQKN